MEEAPPCSGCRWLAAGDMCRRPIGSQWSALPYQRRSHLFVRASFERSNRKFFGQRREKCGPEGLFWEPKPEPAIGGMSGTVIIDEAAGFARKHDTIADSDGDDGA